MPLLLLVSSPLGLPVDPTTRAAETVAKKRHEQTATSTPCFAAFNATFRMCRSGISWSRRLSGDDPVSSDRAQTCVLPLFSSAFGVPCMRAIRAAATTAEQHRGSASVEKLRSTAFPAPFCVRPKCSRWSHRCSSRGSLAAHGAQNWGLLQFPARFRKASV